MILYISLIFDFLNETLITSFSILSAIQMRRRGTSIFSNPWKVLSLLFLALMLYLYNKKTKNNLSPEEKAEIKEFAKVVEKKRLRTETNEFGLSLKYEIQNYEKKNIKKLYNKATQLAHKGDYKKAVKKYSETINCLRDMGKQPFSATISNDPQFSVELKKEGFFFDKRDWFNSKRLLIRGFKDGISILAMAYNNRALCYENLGDFPLAIEDLNFAKELDENSNKKPQLSQFNKDNYTPKRFKPLL